MKFTKILPVLAVLIAGMCLMAGAVSFSDVEGHWAYEQIMEYAEKGIINGDTEGTFRPDDVVTREEFCKIMLNSFGFAGVKSENASFSDVTNEAWSYTFVEGAKKYLPGYEDGTFKPSDAARRDDVTSAIVKIMGYPTGIIAGKGSDLSFTDASLVNEKLTDYVGIAVSEGLVNGFPDGTFRPDAGITRAEVVTLIARAVNKYKEKSFTWDDAINYADAYLTKEEADTEIMMTVNGHDVTRAEYRYYYLTYRDTFDYYFGGDWANNAEMYETFAMTVERDTVLTGTLRSIANEKGVKISLSDINEQAFLQYEYIEELCKSKGETVKSYLEKLHATPHYMIVNCIAAAFANETQNVLADSDSEQYKELAETIKKDYVRAKHILIMLEGRQTREEAYSIAEEVYNKAVSGVDFDLLIAEYNEDPGMESNPDGYVFTKGMMVEPFEKAAYALEAGQISDIVETTYGYHIIKKLELDDESVKNSDAYKAAVSGAFDELLGAEYEKVQVTMTDEFDELIMKVFAEAGHLVNEEPKADAVDIATASAEAIIDAINEIEAPEFMFGVIPVEISDADALKMYTGLDSAEGIKEVAVCESMMGSQAYSLVVVKLENADNAKKIAEAMKAGIDPRKWICVEADDLKVSAKGDVVMLIMVDSEYKESISAASVTEAFKTVCGGTLDFEL